MNTPKRIYIGQPNLTIETLYTVPSNVTTIIKNIVLTNTTGTDATIDVHFVPNGDMVSEANKIFSNYTVGQNNTEVIELSAVIEEGDSITALQGTENSITVYISGMEIS